MESTFQFNSTRFQWTLLDSIGISCNMDAMLKIQTDSDGIQYMLLLSQHKKLGASTRIEP